MRTTRKKKYTRKRNVQASNYRKRYRRAVATRNRRSVTLGKGFPKKVTMTHKYKCTLSANANGTFQRYDFRANGMFDPEVAVGGHQPMYFDQMTALYDQYTVIGSRIKITITRTPSGNNGVDPIYFVLFNNDDTSVAGTSVIDVAESNSGRIKIAAPDAGYHPTSLVLTSKYSAKKTYGNAQLNNTNIQGTATSDPPEQTYYTLCYQTGAGAAVCAWQALVEIDYIAVWTEVKEIASS